MDLTTAATTITNYYTAGTTGPCPNTPLWAGLQCQTKQAAAPAAPSGAPSGASPGPAAPFISYLSYDRYFNLQQLIEDYPAYNAPFYSSPQARRTTNTTYDTASRKSTQQTTVDSTVPGNVNLPKVQWTYDVPTGQVGSTQWLDASGNPTATITTAYDGNGRVRKYTDTTTNTVSTGTGVTVTPANDTVTTCDLNGRVHVAKDRVDSSGNAKNTYTYSYETAAGENRGLLTGLVADTVTDGGSTKSVPFTAGYDADGKMVTETYGSPNLAATTAYDNDGDATKLTYVNTFTPAGTTTPTTATWLAFTAGRGADSRIVKQASYRGSAVPANQVSNQTYSYDGAGRLTTVKDTYAAACTTRQYYFAGAPGQNSNRSALATTAGNGTTCATPAYTPGSPPTTQNTYDTADHLLTIPNPRGGLSLYSYDALGRTIGVPGADAVGIGPNAGNTSGPGIGYWSNDMVRTETQSGSNAKTLEFTLDPNGSRINTTTDTATGSSTGTITTNHYDGDNDNPDWTSTATTASPTTVTGWKRLIEGPDGDLAATIDQTGALTFNLANLHGDIVATATENATTTPPAGATNTTVSTYSESTEYGAPRDPATAQSPYGWTGEKRRSNLDLAGLITMGVRLYNPATGRFLQLDPVEGGGANDYAYPTDPINVFDLNGQFWKQLGRWAKKHRGTLATIGAGLACIGGPLVCAGAQALAYGVRAQQRIQAKGFRRSIKGNLLDLGLTALSFGQGRAAAYGMKGLGIGAMKILKPAAGMSRGGTAAQWGVLFGANYSMGWAIGKARSRW